VGLFHLMNQSYDMTNYNTIKKLTLVQVCPTFVDLEKESGGVANVVRQLSLRLAAKGYDIIIVCGNRELGRVVAKEGEQVYSNNIKVRVFDQMWHPALGPIRELKGYINNINRQCIVHIHTCFSAFTEAAMNVANNKQFPIVFSPHGKLSPHMLSNYGLFKRLWWRLITRKLLKKSTVIGVMSSMETQEFERLDIQDNPFTVIPNGFEKVGKEELDCHLNSEKYILFLGYIDPRKQPEFLVEAFAKSKASKTHKLLFVGPDLYGFWEKVWEVAKSQQVEEAVSWVGSAYGSKKWSYLYNASLVCLPSLAEGLPVVLCEALGAGVPVVYSEQCNFPEISVSGAGVELREFDPGLWANAIDEIVSNIDKRDMMVSNALKLSRHYDWDVIVSEWERVYLGLS